MFAPGYIPGSAQQAALAAAAQFATDEAAVEADAATGILPPPASSHILAQFGVTGTASGGGSNGVNFDPAKPGIGVI
jgi:hypothetical protein